MKPIEINAADFAKEVLQSQVPVIVDFHATWCGPCHRMAPILDELAAAANGAYKICKIDIDDNQTLATEYKVQFVPTMILFKNGQEVERQVGAIPKENLVSMLNS